MPAATALSQVRRQVRRQALLLDMGRITRPVGRQARQVGQMGLVLLLPEGVRLRLRQVLLQWRARL